MNLKIKKEAEALKKVQNVFFSNEEFVLLKKNHFYILKMLFNSNIKKSASQILHPNIK